MTYCFEKQAPCQWAAVNGRCQLTACRRELVMTNGQAVFIGQQGTVDVPAWEECNSDT